MSVEYPYSEVDAAVNLGLTMRDLRRLKKNVPPGECAVVDGTARLTVAGLEAIKKAAGLPAGCEVAMPEISQTEGLPAQPEPPVVLTMTVERLCPNPTFVRARTQDLALVDVKVFNNHNMHRHQVIKAVQKGDGKYYQVVMKP